MRCNGFLFYFIFLIFGVTSLLPWNLFINAHEYFLKKFGNDSAVNTTTYLQTVFENSFALSGSATAVIGLLFNTLIIKKTSNFCRMIVGHTALLLCLVATAILTKVDSTTWQREFFVCTLVLLVLSNLASNVIQGSSVGLAAVFPGAEMQANFAGQAVAGVLVSLADVITLATGRGDPCTSALWYFSFGIFAVAASLASYMILLKLTAAQRYLTILDDSKADFSDDDDENDRDAEVSPLLDEVVNDQKFEISDGNCSGILQTFVSIRLYCATVFVIFAVTLSVFPALLSKVISNSTKNTWFSRNFTAVTCFLLYNVSDCLGRFLTTNFRRPARKSRWILILSLLRVLFIFSFLMTNIDHRRFFWPNWLNDDFCFAILVLFFGLSNGFISTLAFLYFPHEVRKEDAELGGSLMSFCSVTGIFVGSLLSFAIVSIA